MMTFPQTLTSSSSTNLVIDFSDVQYPHKHPSLETDIQNLLQWVRSSPRRGSIHVIVRSGIVSASNRRLQSTLQSLGCRVTTKVSAPRS